jgi:hypothetical protein
MTSSTDFSGFAESLSVVLDRAPSAKVLSRMRNALSCLHSQSHEDFQQIFQLECLSDKKKGIPLTDAQILRIIDRVKSRIVRLGRRREFIHQNRPVEAVAVCDADPTLPVVLRDALEQLWTHATPIELLFAERLLAGEQRIARIASELGISTATAYRIRTRLRERLKAILDT